MNVLHLMSTPRLKDRWLQRIARTESNRSELKLVLVAKGRDIEGGLSRIEAYAMMCAYTDLCGDCVKFEGSGTRLDDPIVISDVAGHIEAVDSEYVYLRSRLGQRGTDWKLQRQSILEHNGRMIDAMDIELADGTKLVLYFDITKYWGRF